MLNRFSCPLSVKTKGHIAYLYQTEAVVIVKTLHGLLKAHWNEEELLAECDQLKR